jgi:hypothetical protein
MPDNPNTAEPEKPRRAGFNSADEKMAQRQNDF